MASKNPLRKLLRMTGFDLLRVDSLDYLERAAQLYDTENQLVKALHDRDINHVLDVGGNVGVYGLKLRGKNYTGKITSFEPIPSVYDKLEKCAANDSNWDTQCIALGDQQETREINVSNNTVSSSFLGMNKKHTDAAPESRYESKVEVTVKTLDGIWSELVKANEKVFMKIDVQGFEKEVLAGASDSLKKIQGLQLECSFASLYEGEMLFPEMYQWLQNEGFTLWLMTPTFIEPKTKQLLQVDAVFFRE
ncbi:FkbM family methyltransferase [Rubellicoccus peritrichatus]|uniref:FkbM family methyltransferase n=1 Tax=Rubellicoccus peritrichatus TaxID=3080537 RepID=A0AAQ3LA16_9BACT|nr:FkbM family methyltransferase [Puniceicoccus sp. CR14]WOO41442.1 FkbM family methyltransferase [Puniceicoccus sp. CR14]